MTEPSSDETISHMNLTTSRRRSASSRRRKWYSRGDEPLVGVRDADLELAVAPDLEYRGHLHLGGRFAHLLRRHQHVLAVRGPQLGDHRSAPLGSPSFQTVT
jgi:hypothetical protein